MPKTKEQSRYKKKYSEDDIKLVFKAIKNGMSRNAASKVFGVPRSTVHFRLSNKFVKTEHGPKPIFTKEEEDILVRWLITNQRKGFPRIKEDVLTCAKEFLDSSPRKNPFKNNTPGDGWFKAFLKRHPILTSTAGADESEINNVEKWFSSIKEYLVEEGLEQILEDPSRIFNGDETCFQLCPKGKEVLTPKGTRNKVDVGSGKLTITVMITFGADGKITPPMIIYPNKRRSLDIAKTVPDEWDYRISDDGCMKPELFYVYINNVFYPNLKKNGIIFPVILFVDGHAIHMTYALSELCSKLKIILIALDSKADVAAFKPLKTDWKKGIKEWKQLHPTEVLTKEKLGPVLEVILPNSLEKQTIIDGFKACRIYPWNPNSIDYTYTKCLQNVFHQEFPMDDTKVLCYEDFNGIVGEELLKQFQEYQNYGNKGEYFDKLFQIWKHFCKGTNFDDTETTLLEETKLEIFEPKIEEEEYDTDNSFKFDFNESK